MKDTFGSTDSLKGFAICAVLINHYLLHNIKGNFSGFASLFVSIFFIVSGYGIYCSLKRSGFLDKPRFNKLLTFYFNRLIRIYPLFLTAYLMQSLFFVGNVVAWSVFGIHARGHFWFIPAIIQCYLLAPLIAIAIKKYRFIAVNCIIISFVALNLLLNLSLLPPGFGNPLKFIHLHWRDVYFLYLLLFSLSMVLPVYLNSWSDIPAYEKTYWVMLLVIFGLTMMIVFKYLAPSDYLYTLFTRTLCPLLILCTAAVLLLSNKLSVPVLAWIGKSSYSIYLFHVIVYRSINEIFGIGKNSFVELLIVASVIPLFFYLCTFIEKWNNTISSSFRLR